MDENSAKSVINGINFVNRERGIAVAVSSHNRKVLSSNPLTAKTVHTDLSAKISCFVVNQSPKIWYTIRGGRIVCCGLSLARFIQV